MIGVGVPQEAGDGPSGDDTPASTINARMVIIEEPSDENPFGLFAMDFEAIPDDDPDGDRVRVLNNGLRRICRCVLDGEWYSRFTENPGLGGGWVGLPPSPGDGGDPGGGAGLAMVADARVTSCIR